MFTNCTWLLSSSLHMAELSANRWWSSCTPAVCMYGGATRPCKKHVGNDEQCYTVAAVTVLCSLLCDQQTRDCGSCLLFQLTVDVGKAEGCLHTQKAATVRIKTERSTPTAPSFQSTHHQHLLHSLALPSIPYHSPAASSSHWSEEQEHFGRHCSPLQ